MYQPRYRVQLKRSPDHDSPDVTAYAWRVTTSAGHGKVTDNVLVLREDGGIVPLRSGDPGFWFTTAAAVLANHMRRTGQRPERVDWHTPALPPPATSPAAFSATPQPAQGLGTLADRADRTRRRADPSR